MTKQEMRKLVRSMGADENTVTAMENAYEMGVEFERARIIEANKEAIKEVNAFLAFKELRGEA